MYLPQPSDSSDFIPPPSGSHPAICYRFIDLGTQPSNFNGQAKTAHKIMLSWEITDPDLRMADGQPFTISSRYTWSMHEKATLRKMLEAWRGTPFKDSDFGDGGFDTRKLLGVGCLLNVLHETKGDRTYANIGGIMKLPKGMFAGELVNKTAYLALTPEGFSRDVFNELSDRMQDIIKASPEYQALVRPAGSADFIPPNFSENPGAGIDEDIPF